MISLVHSPLYIIYFANISVNLGKFALPWENLGYREKICFAIEKVMFTLENFHKQG